MPMNDSKGHAAALLSTEAIRAGWRSWAGMLAVLVVGVVVVAASQPISGVMGTGLRSLAGVVLVGVSLGWLVLLGAVVLLLRSYCFQSAWGGRAVEPGSYLKGMYQVWGVLVVGGLLGLLGAMLMGSLMPGGLVAMLSLLALVFVRPDGRALGL